MVREVTISSRKDAGLPRNETPRAILIDERIGTTIAQSAVNGVSELIGILGVEVDDLRRTAMTHARILVVLSDDESRTAVEHALSSTDHHVTYLSRFQEAKERIEIAPPDLIITAVKLGAYNGLHLVLRARADRADMPAIVLHTEHDPVLAREATSAGAIFVVTPFDTLRFESVVHETLGEIDPHMSTVVPRRWPRKQVAVQAKIGVTEARVVDVSYGGLRVEIDALDQPLERLATVNIPEWGTVPVHGVWARGGGATGRWWCGAEVDASDERISQLWREFVDSLN